MLQVPWERGCARWRDGEADLEELQRGRSSDGAGEELGGRAGVGPGGRGPLGGRRLLWQARVGQGSALGGIEWGPTADTENAYVAVSDVLVREGKGPGGLHALRLDTGAKIWTTPPAELHCTAGTKGCNSAQSAAISSI